MTYSTVSVPSTIDATPITVYAWEPPQTPRGAVQISHGVAEHGPRYDRLAAALTAAGYAVYAHDHRGHGSSISEEVMWADSERPDGAGWSPTSCAGRQDSGERLGRPLFLLGHSMGSFALQEAILDRSAGSGRRPLRSTALDVFTAGLAEPVAKVSISRRSTQATNSAPGTSG